MNGQNLVRTGHIAVGSYITASDIDFPDSIEDLTKILGTLNSEKILAILASVNWLIQHTEDLSLTDEALQEAFCSPILINQIDYKAPAGSFIFGRQSTLYLLTEIARLFDANSQSDISQTETKNKLARSYLIANGLSGEEDLDSQNDLETNGEDEWADHKRSILVNFIPLSEYGIRPLSSRSTGELFVRTHELFHRLQKAGSKINVDGIFCEATGLTLQEYYYLIALILAKYLNFSRASIMEGESLYVDLEHTPTLKPLYDKLLPHACVSVDVLATKAEESVSLKNEFRLWRQYPLVKVSGDRIICIDISFLLNKLQSGMFWIIRDQLEKNRKGDGQQIIGLWGDVFEDYAGSIIKRGINSQTPTIEKCILNPKYIGKSESECTDIAVCSDDTLILLECKAPLLSASAKFSGDFDKLCRELQSKLVEARTKKGKGKAKGITQLWKAIQALGHTNKKKRRRVEGIDISKVKKIYPVLVLSDGVFGSPCMNWFLNSEFQRFVKCGMLKKHLKIMPLTILTAEHLEQLEPWLSNTPFYAHLDKWLELFKRNDVRGFGEYAYSLHEHTSRKNLFMSQQLDLIMKEVYEYITSLGSDL